MRFGEPRVLQVIALAGVLAGWPTHATAQPIVPVSTIQPAKGGACSVTVTVGTGLPAGTEIDLALNGLWLARQDVGSRPQIVFALIAPVQHLDRLQLREVSVTRITDWGAEVEVQAADAGAAPQCTPRAQRPAPDDQRSGLWASFYVGSAVDTFAPEVVGGYQYANPGAGGTSAFERAIGGVDFEFRTIGSAASDRQLWIIGETLYGTRSGDIDCTTPEKRPAVCASIQDTIKNPVTASNQFLYALEHATSFEAYIAPRLELWTLQRGSLFPAKLYVVARMGILMLNEETHDAFEAFHVGGGLLSHSGAFSGSYIEVGYGKSEMFFTPKGYTPWRRLKLDALFSVPTFGKGEKRPRLFLQLYSDFDPHNVTADSIQTFFGLDISLSELFK